jgi:hypothetical protein
LLGCARARHWQEMGLPHWECGRLARPGRPVRPFYRPGWQRGAAMEGLHENRRVWASDCGRVVAAYYCSANGRIAADPIHCCANGRRAAHGATAVAGRARRFHPRGWRLRRDGGLRKGPRSGCRVRLVAGGSAGRAAGMSFAAAAQDQWPWSHTCAWCRLGRWHPGRPGCDLASAVTASAGYPAHLTKEWTRARGPHSSYAAEQDRAGTA